MRPLCLIALCVAQAHAAGWISTRIGPFAVYSEANPKETRECAAEMEQMRFSIGELLGRRDLTIHSQLQLFLLTDVSVENPSGTTRTGAIALVQKAGPLTQENRGKLVHLLFEQNIGRMADALERGLETVLATATISGAHVTWGALPPEAERTPQWRLLDWLITNPDTYGNVRVLLANLENGEDEEVAFQSAFHQSKSQLEQQARSGVLATIDAPSRPLSPERDLAIRSTDANDVTLHLADLLNADSVSRYRSLLNSGVHKTEAEEGLALLAARAGDVATAAEYIKKAVADGSKNAFAMIEYARVETDAAKARSALEKAVAVDPDSAGAHFLLGRHDPDPAARLNQWQIAVKLDPRNEEYWVSFAKALEEQKRWAEAAKAWSGAEQAAPTAAAREKMMNARTALEGRRLDDDEAQKRKEDEDREREINRLKQQTIAEIRAAEAKVNGAHATGDSAKPVPWDELDGGNAHVEGKLVRVECFARQMRLLLLVAGGKQIKLNAGGALNGSEELRKQLACGAQRERPVSVTYEPRPDRRTGTAGNLLTIQFH